MVPIVADLCSQCYTADDMELFLLGFFLLLAIVGGFIALDRRLRAIQQPREQDPAMMMLNQNVQGLQQVLNTSVQNMQQSVTSRLDKAAEAYTLVSRELGKVQEMGRSMKDLQDFLKSPKLRGNIGEQVMKDLLEQYFPRANFDTQYQFQSGERVDAILKTDKGLIPIDAKFPLENFQRMARAETEDDRLLMQREFIKDVKKHITDIAKKYILPGENTVDFAVMYIPSEAVYYEIVRNDEDLNAFAQQKHVFPVSPNSFFYFIKVIMIGLEGKRVEETAHRILELLRAIQTDATRFGGELDKLTTHVTNAKNTVDRVNTEYAKLAGKIDDVRLLK